jgi:hypothetical protein
MQKQVIEGLTAIINERLDEMKRIYMVDSNSGDETPDQAVGWDFHVNGLATILLEIKDQNN